MAARYVFEELNGGISQGREIYQTLDAVTAAARDWAVDYRDRHNEWPQDGWDYRVYRQETLDIDIRRDDCACDYDMKRRLFLAGLREVSADAA